MLMKTVSAVTEAVSPVPQGIAFCNQKIQT